MQWCTAGRRDRDRGTGLRHHRPREQPGTSPGLRLRRAGERCNRKPDCRHWPSTGSAVGRHRAGDRQPPPGQRSFNSRPCLRQRRGRRRPCPSCYPGCPNRLRCPAHSCHCSSSRAQVPRTTSYCTTPMPCVMSWVLSSSSPWGSPRWDSTSRTTCFAVTGW